MPDPQTLLLAVQQATSLDERQMRIADQRSWFADPEFSEQFCSLLKQRAEHFLGADKQQSQEFASLILYIAELTHSDWAQALGLRATANIIILSESKYAQGHALLEQAGQIYLSHNLPVEWAKTQIINIYCLNELNFYDEAVRIAEQARQILTASEQFEALSTLLMNWAVIYDERCQYELSLEKLDQAQAAQARLAQPNLARLGQIANNRLKLQRLLGQFDQAVITSRQAIAQLEQAGQTIEASRARWNLGKTYLVIGRSNDAFQLLNQAHQVLDAGGWQKDALDVELDICDLLLRLRQFSDVIARISQIQQRKFESEITAAQLHMIEAGAYVGLATQDKKALDQALQALQAASDQVSVRDNQTWMTWVDQEIATVLYYQQAYHHSLEVALRCAQFWETKNLPVEAAQAHLATGRAALALNQLDLARQHLNQAAEINQSEKLAGLAYGLHTLLGQLEEQSDRPIAALAHYEQAISNLEQLRGWLMVEHRVDFVEDKQAVYEDAVRLYLAVGEPLRGLEYAERAKSRALLDLLAYQIELRIQPITPEDTGLIEKLHEYKARRDAWLSETPTDDSNTLLAQRQTTRRNVEQLEQKITTLWHQLLSRHADYARQADIWQVQVSEILPYLNPETLLLEYFIVRNELVLFTVFQNQAEAISLGTVLDEIAEQMRFFELNRQAVRLLPDAAIPAVQRKLGTILQRLYQLLIQPAQARLAQCKKIRIIPHRQLHYIPFHTLHNGQQFLIETHEIAYLPSASLLRYCQQPVQGTQQVVCFGYSNQQQIPLVCAEAELVARLCGGRAWIEADSTLATFRQHAPTADLIHLATHGQFNATHPLLSGLDLADGQLTTLDIFNLRLQANLVTLSACQTGQSQIHQGDELSGLSRALLYAGARALLLSLWAVEDRATLQLMEQFYTHMIQGYSKSAALQAAQIYLLRQKEQPRYQHPFYWAPFFLVGNTDPLWRER